MTVWMCRCVDVSVRRYKCTETNEKICRKKDRTDVKERQCGCAATVCRCDIDVQMCGCGEVER